MGAEQRGWVVHNRHLFNCQVAGGIRMNVQKPKVKPFAISKKLIFEAYEKVKANKGAAGVDKQSIAEFEENLKDNLYMLWNRMSSGCYFPPPIRAVEIPKKGQGRSAYPPWLTELARRQ